MKCTLLLMPKEKAQLCIHVPPQVEGPFGLFISLCADVAAHLWYPTRSQISFALRDLKFSLMLEGRNPYEVKQFSNVQYSLASNEAA